MTLFSAIGVRPLVPPYILSMLFKFNVKTLLHFAPIVGALLQEVLACKDVC